MLSRDSKFNYIFVLSTSGTNALARTTDQLFDIIMIDCNLPDMTGADCLSIMRSGVHTQSQQPPAIICTSAGSEDSATAAVRAGADDYLSKRCINNTSFGVQIRRFSKCNPLNIRVITQIFKNKSGVLRFHYKCRVFCKINFNSNTSVVGKIYKYPVKQGEMNSKI